MALKCFPQRLNRRDKQIAQTPQASLTLPVGAREFGLPAVINMPGQLKAAQNGQLVTVDGDQGCSLLDGVGE